LKLAGAAWKDGRLELSDGQPISLASSQITWLSKDQEVPGMKGSKVNLPVYLNGDRSEVLFSVDLETDGTGQDAAAQRGVCMTAA
jgi:dynein heavy chain 1